MSTSSQPVFKGYAIKDTKQWHDFHVIEYEPKTWEETDVELKITHCGVCGSDVHTIHPEGWQATNFPVIPGHEIVGTVTKVGSQVKEFKVGQRVGIGAHIGSCLKCRACKTDNENYCPKGIPTYNGKYPDGVVTQGGYSTAIRANQQFVFPIPDKLESKHAASMLCGGLTVYSPLVRNGCGPGKKVGIVGIGGLGHYAVLFAKALGAEVYAFTHSESKIKDIEELGADHVVLTDKEGWEKPLALTLDLIVSTRDSAGGFPIEEFLSMLWVGGSFITVGIPDSPLPELKAFTLINNGCKIGGSAIGSKKEAIEMLKLAADKGVKPWITEMPMSKAGEAVQAVKNNDVRYRIVLTQDLQ